MKKHNIQQKTERRISAALRLVLAVVLLLAQIALVFLLSQRESQLIVLAERNLPLQLMAEDLLEEQRIRLQGDFAGVDEFFAMESWRIKEIASGSRDGMAYRVTIKRAEDEDRLILVSHTEYEKQMMFGTEYLLQWCLYADREQERLVLERIG